MSKQQARKAGDNSRRWNQPGIAGRSELSVFHHGSEINHQDRRCAICEEDERIRESVNHWVWVSEVGDWYPIPQTGVQLFRRGDRTGKHGYPPHHQNEHFDLHAFEKPLTGVDTHGSLRIEGVEINAD